MAKGILQAEGIGNFVYPAINGTSAALTRGRPIMRKGTAANEGEIIYGRDGAALGEFAGVLSQDLEYNGVADLTSSKLKAYGKVRADVYVTTASLYVAGIHLLPVWDATNGSYFKIASRPTGIRLITAMTDKSDSTLYTVPTGGGAYIFIDPSVGYYRGPLHYYWEGPVVADADYYATATATSGSVTTEVTSFLNSGRPDYARNVTITPGGTTTDVAAGNIVVTGTNIFGETITESIAIAANASSAVTGASAFATITSVLFPIQDGAAATFTIGTGSKLGLGRCFPAAPICLDAYLGGTVEGTAATLTGDADEVEKNGITLDSALDGSIVEALIHAA